MTGNDYYSKWGIKDSGEDITNDILGIVDKATSFIIVGGYNFTFETAGYTFFNLLLNKSRAKVPILMIFPPHLSGNYNTQPQVIDFCLRNGIGLILNGNNHSKWLLTEHDLYYGSSNFTKTSWKHRIEVITIHKHSNLYRNWKLDTVLDFTSFIQRQILTINRRMAMRSYRGLIDHTIETWNNINPLIQRLNPSIEKVKLTLENYNEVEYLLEEIIEEWFKYYDPKAFSTIYNMNIEILQSVRNVCEYAYFHIYNETKENQKEFSKDNIIEEYNNLHKKVAITIEKASESLINMKGPELYHFERPSQLFEKNLGIINEIEQRFNKWKNTK